MPVAFDPNDELSLEGTLVGGTYTVGRLIGKGGMGAVYEAHHTRVPRRFAIKFLRGVVGRNESLLARFRREAMIGSQLGHEHIVQVFDFDYLPDGSPYLVMELLQGQGLDALIAEGPVPLARAVAIVRQVAVALADAHDHGIVHRDLKPENIFLCRRSDGGETAKVLDFGICKVLASQTIVTADATVFGSPRYMAPEQALGKTVDIDPRTDLFALGLVFFHMLAGRAPFDGDSPTALIFQVVYTPLPSMGQLRPDLPQPLVALIEKAASKEPELRHADARAFIADLDRAMGHIGAAPLVEQPAAAVLPSRSVPPVSPEQFAATLTGPPAPWPAAPGRSSPARAVQTGTTLSSAAAELGAVAPAPRLLRTRWLLGGMAATVLLVAVFVIIWVQRPGRQAPTRPAPTRAATVSPPPVTAPPRRAASTPPPVPAPADAGAPATAASPPEPAEVGQPAATPTRKAVPVKKRVADKKSSAAAKRPRAKKQLLGEGLPDD